MKRQTRNAVRSLVAVAGACASVPASGIIINWNNPAGGSAATAANWNPAQTPHATADLQFALNGTYTVTWPLSVVTARSHTYYRGVVTGSFSNHTIAGQLVVGMLNGDNATLRTQGTLKSSGFMTIAQNTGSTGLLIADDSTVQVIGAGSDLVVGQGGQGTLDVINGGDVVTSATADDIIIGNLAEGLGAVTVSGASEAIASFGTNNAAEGDLIVGASGSGTLDVFSHSNVSSARDIVLALNPGSTGAVTVGGSSVVAAGCRTDRDLHVGHNTTSSASGSAALTIGAGGTVRVGPASGGASMFIGDPHGGSGTLNMQGGLLETKFLNLDPLNGAVNHTGGTIRVLPEGGFTSHSLRTINGSVFRQPTLIFDRAVGTLTGGFLLGSTQTGAMRVENGSVVNAVTHSASNAAMLGQSAGSSGSLVISGTGSELGLSIPGLTFMVGFFGSGSLSILDSGFLDVNSTATAVASRVGSTAQVVISDGSRWRSASTVAFGGNRSTPGGNASVEITGGSFLVCQELFVHPGAIVNLNDSVVTVDRDAVLSGSISMSNGSEIAADAMTVRGAVNGSGNLYGDVMIEPGGVVTAMGGGLEIGSPFNSANGFSSAGTLSVGASTVRVLDADASAAGIVTMGGGHIFANGLTFSPGGGLSGFGGLSTPVMVNSGVIVTPSGSGLMFNGPVVCAGGQFTGTRVLFAAGGDFSGHGLVTCKVESEEEASINASETLVLGSNSVGGAVILNGSLHVGSARVELRSDTAPRLGVLTTIEGGTLLGPEDNTRSVTVFGFPPTTRTVFDAVPIELGEFDVLTGFGVVDHKLTTVAGSRVTATGSLTIAGSASPTLFPDTPLDAGNKYAPWNGDLEVGPHTVTFSSFHQLGGTTTLGGGLIHFSSGVGLVGRVQGSGVLSVSDGGEVRNAGTLSPGGTGRGVITIEGEFRNSFVAGLLNVPGVVELDIGGDQGEENDVLRVTGGDVHLLGDLRVGTFGLAPDPNYEYRIIIAEQGMILGEFDQVELPEGMTIEYRTHEVVITGFCFADFNRDGGIDGADVDAFFAAWEAGEFATDVNRDGGVDGVDVETFFAAWEAGGCV